MNWEDLREGEIYVANYKDSRQRYLFRKNNTITIPMLFLHNNYFLQYGGDVYYKTNDCFTRDCYREATEDQKRHYYACLEAGKWVPKPEIPKEVIFNIFN